MVELADQRILASAGTLRNEVFAYDKDGGHTTTPLFTLDAPVMDMAVDRFGQLWVMTGAELLQVDANDGTVLQRLKGPGQDPLTHALAIHPSTGEIYVSSGNGIEVFNSGAETDPTKAWKHFSNQRVGDLAFGPDGRLWAVTWTGSSISGAQPGATTDIVSFPMTGRTAGRPELEFRLAGLIDSISFGATGTPLAGLLLASSNLRQRAVVEGATEPTPHQSSVWMLELQSRRVLQVASGGTRGESIVTTADGRILVAQTGHIDEIAVRGSADSSRQSPSPMARWCRCRSTRSASSSTRRCGWAIRPPTTPAACSTRQLHSDRCSMAAPRLHPRSIPNPSAGMPPRAPPGSMSMACRRAATSLTSTATATAPIRRSNTAISPPSPRSTT
jgi:hypothetical protein